MIRIKDVLSKMKVKDLLHREVTVLDPAVSVEDAVREEFARQDYGTIPIVCGKNIVGLLTLSEIRKIPRFQWDGVRVSKIMKEISKSNSVHREESALVALTKMVKTKLDLLPVVEHTTLKGVITQDDLMGIINSTTDDSSAFLP